MVYGQYTTAKGCIQALRVCRTKEQPLAVVYWPYTTLPQPYFLDGSSSNILDIVSVDTICSALTVNACVHGHLDHR